MSLLELFVEVDDFCQAFERWAAKQQLPGRSKRGPAPVTSASEVMTIVIHLHQGGYRDFKHYYQKHVCKHLTAEFPTLVSYGRFVKLMPRVVLLLCAYLRHRFGRCTDIAFVDSTPLAVCHIERAKPGPLGLVRRKRCRVRQPVTRWILRPRRLLSHEATFTAVHTSPSGVGLKSASRSSISSSVPQRKAASDPPHCWPPRLTVSTPSIPLSL